MSVTLVVGGQYGKEGKGKIAQWLGMNYGCDYAVKITNSFTGLRKIDDSSSPILSSARNSNDSTIYVILPRQYVELKGLLQEISKRNLSKERLIISKDSIIVEASPNGIDSYKNASSVQELKEYIGDTLDVLTKAVEQDCSIIIEGSDGYAFSKINVGTDTNILPLPYVTASEVLGAVGLSPLDVTNIVLCITKYPKSNSYTLPFGIETIKDAILVNNPTIIAYNNLDLVDGSITDTDELTEEQMKEITSMEEKLNVDIDLVGNGPNSVIKLDALLERDSIDSLLGKGDSLSDALDEMESLVDQVLTR